MEIVFVAIITTFGMIISILLWNHNWFKRLDAKYKYDLKKKRMQHKYTKAGVTSPDRTRSSIGNLSSYLPILKNLDDDQLLALRDILLGNADSESYQDDDLITKIIKVIPPDIIKGFLQGAMKKNEKTEEERGQV